LKKVTIKDVAREANVSVGTVYRAINNTGRIKKETRERVLKVVERLGYRANTVARGLALRKKFVILVIMPYAPEIFWDEVRKGTRMAAAELSELNVQIIEFNHVNGKCQNRNIRDILDTNEIDAIAMAPVMFDDHEYVTKYANENNIPLATFDDDTSAGERLFYYGPDDYLAGQMAAELMYKFSGGSGTCCIISRSVDNSYKRVQGFKEYIEKNYLDFGIGKIYICTTEEAMSVVGQAIKEFPDAKGFYCDQYTTLYNSYRLFEQAGKKYVVIGHEYNEEYKEALRKGTITAILAQERVCQGYYPVKMLYEYLITGEKPSKDTYYSNINIIIGTNADYLQHNEYGCGYE
jgi:LacI family transcriptional regulator